MLTPREKKLIKKLSHDLKPLIRIGKNGVTPATIANIDRALKDHELIKIKYLEHKDQKKTLTRQIIEETGSELINQIGNTATLYRESPDPQKRNIDPSKKQTKIRR
jgi:RNA-binding protein